MAATPCIICYEPGARCLRKASHVVICSSHCFEVWWQTKSALEHAHGNSHERCSVCQSGMPCAPKRKIEISETDSSESDSSETSTSREPSPKRARTEDPHPRTHTERINAYKQLANEKRICVNGICVPIGIVFEGSGKGDQFAELLYSTKELPTMANAGQLKERELFVISCRSAINKVSCDHDEGIRFAASCRAIHHRGVNVVEMTRVRVTGIKYGRMFRPVRHTFMPCEDAVQFALAKCPCGSLDNNCGTRRMIDLFQPQLDTYDPEKRLLWVFHDTDFCNLMMMYSNASILDEDDEYRSDWIEWQEVDEAFSLTCFHYAVDVSAEHKQTVMASLKSTVPNGVCVVYAELDPSECKYKYRHARAISYEAALVYMPSPMAWHGTEAESDVCELTNLRAQFQTMYDQHDPETEMVWLFVGSTGYVYALRVNL